MSSRSAQVATERPFYAAHADAYDALITDPVEPWVAAVHDRLVSAGLQRARVLDAGCGTGRHARALAEKGHTISLLDASAELLAIARERCGESPVYLGDICNLSIDERFDAIICRGVLNDLVSDSERQLALDSFARTLLPNGLLVIDVREAAASELRADGRTRQSEVFLPDGSQLVFTSTPHWREGLIDVEEAYDLSAPGGALTAHSYSFQMKPWTTDELHERLERSGFDRITIQPGVGRRVPDRLLVVARKQSQEDDWHDPLTEKISA